LKTTVEKLVKTFSESGERAEMHEVEYMLCLALDIGEGLLKCGAEVRRVEDTIERICRAYGAMHTEIFAIPSMINAAVRMPDGAYSSQMRRIHNTENNLLKLERYNKISYTVCRERPPLEEVDRMVREVKTKKKIPEWLPFLGSMLGAGAFAVFFGGSWRDGLVAFLVGAVMALLEKIPGKLVNRFAKTAIQSFVGGILAYLSVWIGIGENARMIIIGTIMLLIPGLAFGTALRDLLYGDFLAGTLKTVQVLLIALMIAFGYLLSAFVMGGVS